MSLQHSTDRREAKGEARGSTEQEVIVVPLELGRNGQMRVGVGR